MLFSAVFALCLFCFSYTKNAQAGYYDYNDVLLIINDNSDISVQIGNYFKQQRNIPDANVVHLRTAATEAVDATEFTNNIRTPIENYLTSHNLQNSINYIVTTKGLPLTVNDEGVEQQLMLILGPYSSSILQSGVLNNPSSPYGYQPYYSQNAKFSHTQYGIYLVTRLDGYNWDDIKEIIDRAANPVAPNQGTYEFDIAPGRDDGYGYQTYNDFMRNAADLLMNKGYNVVFDQSGTYLNNIHNVLGYYSWGSNDGAGSNNSIPGNTYVNGAIGDTYVSTGGRSFNYPPSYGQSLIADWIAEGITGIAGYVSEPYCQAVAHPDILYGRYTRGYNLADSFEMATSWAAWKQVVIGDPKTALMKGTNDIPADTVAPARYAGNVGTGIHNIDTKMYNIQLFTDEPAICKYSTTPNTPYASMPNTLKFFVDWAGNLVYYTDFVDVFNPGLYIHYVRCQDSLGNTNTTDYVIVYNYPSDPDITAPVRYNGYPSGTIIADQTETSLVLKTSETATCRYSTNPNTPYDSMSGVFSADAANHQQGPLQSAVIRGLVNGSSYTYYVRCRTTLETPILMTFPFPLLWARKMILLLFSQTEPPAAFFHPAQLKLPCPSPPTRTPPANTQRTPTLPTAPWPTLSPPLVALRIQHQ